MTRRGLNRALVGAVAGGALGATLLGAPAHAAMPRTAALDVAVLAADAPPATIAPAASGIVGSLRPERLYDSRTATPLRPGEDRPICDTSPNIPESAEAVVVNLTAVSPTGPGYLTASALGDDAPPPVSTLNFTQGATTANLAIVPLGAVGCIQVHNGSTGKTHVLVDVQGYLSAGPATVNGSTQTIYPSRILDTRTKHVAIPAHSSLDVQVAGVGGVPPTNVAAAWLNLTVTGNPRAGWLTAYPTGTTRPLSANLNFGAGETRAAGTLAKVGLNGRVTVYNGSSAPAHLVVDAQGFVRSGSGVSALAGVAPVAPTRSMDTRAGAPVAAGEFVYVNRQIGSPPAGASAVILAVTAVDAVQSGYLTVYGSSGGQPSTSTVNFVPGRATTNLVVARLDGHAVVRNGSSQPVDVVVDVVGWVNPERTIAGRVVSQAGEGLLANVYGGNLSPYLGRSATDGSYSFPLPMAMTRVLPCAVASTPNGPPDPSHATGCHRSWTNQVAYTLGLGQRLTGADIPLEPAGIARGSATDSAGAPITSGSVTLRRASDGRAFDGSISNGSWVIGRVGQGDYYVELGSASSATTTPYGLAPEWYPDVQPGPTTVASMAESGAQAVTITPGSTTTVNLVAEPRARLSGTLASADPTRPLGSSARVSLRRGNGSLYATVATNPSAPGAWVSLVHPGTVKACGYRTATAVSSCWEGDVPVDQATPIALTDGQDLNGIAIELP